ncbi:type II toxin-antitoxin system HipA family toxin [Propionivibrio dicarboxylicus]|uniref:Serine/threonine-protein kinase HipA n=1 Tax=Propionivibrio dicarboxylicus TaxID=83767 RepID=A0A1G8EV59_9RHOO|nr:type II toxin-antitoxin system HipA family toxin [Propionivibrio dicarboxylicus]SDH73745.1 serine/threonine-protein kinase HipA [Propionivibrio dicarboxylicus]
MKKLSVIYAGWNEHFLLGTLADDGSQLLFEYSSEALVRGLELSPIHVKLRSQAYAGFPDFLLRLPGFIADALPDGWGLLLQDRAFRARGLNPADLSPLDRLAFVGKHAMGALEFEPDGSDALETRDVELLALANAVQDVLADKDTVLLGQLALMGGSPHGARPKVLVFYDRDTGRMSNLDEMAGESWLVKFPAQSEHKEVCAIEHLYAFMAKQCGIDVPETAYFDIGKKLSAFGIARFDRKQGVRIPVQTLASLLHVNFRVPGTLSYRELLRATRAITHDERDIKQVFLRCVFNVVFNNRDDHPKNFSFLLNQQGRWELAPAYDVTFCEGPGGEHQMDICGEGRKPARRHLLQLAAENGVPRKDAVSSIDAVLAMARAAPDLLKNGRIRRDTVGKLKGIIGENAARLV